MHVFIITVWQSSQTWNDRLQTDTLSWKQYHVAPTSRIVTNWFYTVSFGQPRWEQSAILIFMQPQDVLLITFLPHADPVLKSKPSRQYYRNDTLKMSRETVTTKILLQTPATLPINLSLEPASKHTGRISKSTLPLSGGLVVRRRTCDLVVAGSRPGRDAAA